MTWTAKGYKGGDGAGSLVDSLAGRPAIVAGNGEGVQDQVFHVKQTLENPLVFAANDVGVYLPQVDHWCSLHKEKLFHWAKLREIERGGKDWLTHTAGNKIATFIDYCWDPLEPLFALSGYFAMQLAYLMGCDPIILCGCPGERARRFFDRIPREDYDYQNPGMREQVEKEMARLPEFKKKVKSMSGWTKEFFGGL